METLTQMKCVACRKDAPTVTGAEIAEFHRQVSDWDIVGLDGLKRLRRVSSVDDFAQALEFHEEGRRACRGRGSSPRAADRMGAGRRSHGGRPKSRACIATISSWRRKRTSCISHELIRCHELVHSIVHFRNCSRVPCAGAAALNRVESGRAVARRASDP